MARDQQRPGALDAIGNTPVVRLSTLPGAESADVWVKLEAANPTGSYKDRMALAYALVSVTGADRFICRVAQ
jgi:cysteine synthase